MSAYDTLRRGLFEIGLESIPGSVFDNAFNVFHQERNAVNLVVLGTNGNISDSSNSTLGWLDDRARNPRYSHIKEGDWGSTILQPQLMGIPRCLNECFRAERFREESTIYTNALLLASSGVGDIGNRVKLLSNSASKFQRKKDIIGASMSFFANYTLSLANPDLLFVYGNAEPGDSAWAYIRRHFRVVEDGCSVPITSLTSYKFCSIDTGEKVLPVIGSPHLSYAYNKLNPALIRQGLSKLRTVPPWGLA